MKRLLFALLTIIVLGLCAVCALQWQREFVLNGRIEETTKQLIAENKLRVEFEEKAQRFEQEVARITRLREETEAAMLVLSEELQMFKTEFRHRGVTIAVLMNEVSSRMGQLEAYQKVAGAGADAIREHNTQVAQQNAAIEKANETLKQLTAERDEAIARLNERTQEFNALVEKYNQLTKQP